MKKMKTRVAALLGALAVVIGGGILSCSYNVKDNEAALLASVAGNSSTSNFTPPSFNGNLYPANDSTSAHADTDLMIKFDNTPTINTSDKNLKIRIYDGETQIDAIGSFDETYYSGNNSNGAIGKINVANELISVVGDTVLVKVHTDEQAYPLLTYAKKYTVKIDKGLISGTVGGVDPSELTWSFTTATAPSITGNSIMVGGEDAHFASIQGALNYLRTMNGNWTISVAKDNYHERLSYYGDANVTIVGAESDDDRGSSTVVYWKNSNDWNSSTRARVLFLWQGGNLTLENMTIKSTYSRKDNINGNGNNSSETLYFDSKKDLVAYHSSFLGHQDTLLLGNNGGRAWLYQCYIEGDFDFLWGTANVALFEDCTLNITADDGANQYAIFASRTPSGDKISKGFVLLNSTVLIDNRITSKVYYGSGNGNTQATVLNNQFLGNNGALDSKLWLSEPTTVIYEPSGDMAVGYRDANNTLNGIPISISADERKTNTQELSERVINREYNGRWVIFNRVYNTETDAYEFAGDMSFSGSDITTVARKYGALLEESENNIYVEPVYVNNLLSPDKGGATATLAVKKYNGEDVSVTWTTSDDNLATVEGGVVTAVNDASGIVNIIATTADGHKDWAVVKVIPDALTMTITVDGEEIPQGKTSDYTKEKVLVLDLADTGNLSSDKYKPVITGESASDAKVSYETTLNTIASVTEDGTVTAKHIGNAKITVTESATATTYSYLVHVKDSSPKSSFGVTLQEVPVLSDDPEEARDFGLFAVSSAVRANTNDYRLGSNNIHGLAFGNSQSITIPVQGASTIRFAPNTNNAEANVTVTAANNASVEDTKASKNSVWLAHYTGSTATTLTFTFTGNTYIPAFSVIADSDTTPVNVTWDFGKTGDYPVQTNVIRYEKATGILPDPQTGAYIEIDATSGKFTPRAPAESDVQVNKGTVFYIPVSAQSVATINMKNATYKVNDTEAAATKTTVTASGAGFVKVEVTGNTYIDGSISVTGLKLAEERTGGFFSSTKAD